MEFIVWNEHFSENIMIFTLNNGKLVSLYLLIKATENIFIFAWPFCEISIDFPPTFQWVKLTIYIQNLTIPRNNGNFLLLLLIIIKLYTSFT